MSQAFPGGQPPGASPPGALPAGEVLNEAFQFTLRRWWTVVRFGWLPAALGALAFLGYGALAFEPPGQTVDGAASGLALRMPAFAVFMLGVAVVAVVLYLYAGFMTSIYRLVATGEERGGVFQIRTDPPVARVFWAVLIVNGLTLALFGLGLVLATIVAGRAPGELFSAVAEFASLAAAANAAGAPIPQQEAERLAEPLGVLFLGAVGAMAPITYVNIRLTPFVAGSAVENRLLLFGAFHLTRGRFWSIFLIFFLLIVSILALSIIIELAAEIFNQLGEALTALGGGAGLAGGVLLFIGFLIGVGFQLFSAALQLSAQGIVYRRLKTGA